MTDDVPPPPLTADQLRLADRYLARECSADELLHLQEQLATTPERWTALVALREELAARGTRPAPPVEAARVRLAARMAESARDRRTGVTPLRSWRRLGWTLGFAGATAVPILATVSFFRGTERPPASHTYTTTAGERSTITLATGNTVVLGPATTLHVSGADVTLHGEALFTVAHHTERAFVVRTGSSVIRVLGTRFAVRAYDTDRTARVIVGEGRVSFKSAQSPATPIVLDAGMLGVLTDSGTSSVTRGVTLRDYTSLEDGRLVFRDVALRDVLSDLSRAYDVELRVTDSVLAQRHLTFTASVATESLTDVLDFFAQALDAHYTRSGRTVTFTPGVRAPVRDRSLPLSSEKQYGR